MSLSEFVALAVNLNCCISSKSDIRGAWVISHLRLSHQAEKDSVVALPTDRDASGENKSYEVSDPGEQLPGLGEQLPEPELLHCTGEVGIGNHTDANKNIICGGWVQFGTWSGCRRPGSTR